ncbi:MAG: hypothetical protein NTV49_01830 [Kiritimatiellaeota bacterium]|nr:hypothetical protein [Kiritimatiellota bacterium]
MKKVLLLFGLLALAGCVPSLQPLYTPEDLAFNPALVGVWAETNSPARWVFTKSGDQEYQLVYTDKDGKPGEFKAHLVKAGGQQFLDFYPAGSEPKLNDLYRAHLFPVHTFLLVRRIGPDLPMAMMDPDWLKKHLAEHPAALKHEPVEDGFVLTAQPKELQAFLVKHVDQAFGSVTTLLKVPAPAAPARTSAAP